MQRFAYNTQPARVVFGAGERARLPDEIDRLAACRVLVVCTPAERALAEEMAQRAGRRVAGLFDAAAMHVPVATADAAQALALRLDADAVLAVGGGSTTGLAKALALSTGLPIIAVPTTYAGSEMTPIYGLTEDNRKRTGRDPRVLPRTVIYDPELSVSLPSALSVTSGINAMAHAAEGLYAADANPITNLMAEEGLRAMAAALPRLVVAPADLEARSTALYGAWLCGSVLGAVSMGLHHKLCHTLGGTFNLPHAALHCVVLPHALAYNATAAEPAMRRIAAALGANSAPLALFELARRHGAPTSLAALGMPEDGLDRAVELAAHEQYPNPRALESRPLRALLERAFRGSAPECT